MIGFKLSSDSCLPKAKFEVTSESILGASALRVVDHITGPRQGSKPALGKQGAGPKL